MQQKRPTSRAGKKTAFPAYTFNDFFALTALARKNSCCPKAWPNKPTILLRQIDGSRCDRRSPPNDAGRHAPPLSPRGFYEPFFEDAKGASPLLNLALRIVAALKSLIGSGGGDRRARRAGTGRKFCSFGVVFTGGLQRSFFEASRGLREVSTALPAGDV